jgi:Glycosyl hydrolases family 2, TIM barrel domain
MKNVLSTRLMVLLAGLVAGCCCAADNNDTPPGPAKVEVKQVEGHWQLLVNHQPFYIKGAGLESGDQEKLAAHGGNSFRTWRTANGQQVLDRAYKNGLYVTMGLDIARERHGFDYSDTNAVAGQLAEVKIEVLKYRNHPALLMWDIGNELNLNSTNARVWDAVNDISKMIHQLDPNHPTTTSLAGMNKDLVGQIKTRAPDLDLLAVQMYADIVNLPRYLRTTGWDGPYVVTEWGATGHWEVGRTDWGAPIEDDSTTKADFYRKRYEIAIASDTKQCLGSYVFLWGQKQERTPTWYGMFLKTGEETETVDVLQHIWTGRWPDARSPQCKGLWLAGKTAHENIHLNSGQNYPAMVLVQPLDPSPLAYSWEIMRESGAQTSGGDFEAQPERLPGLVSQKNDGTADVKAPAKPGAYRLFAYAITGNGKAAYANIPFYVDPPTSTTAER